VPFSRGAAWDGTSLRRRRLCGDKILDADAISEPSPDCGVRTTTGRRVVLFPVRYAPRLFMACALLLAWRHFCLNLGRGCCPMELLLEPSPLDAR
jgi:hypothetical protein